MDIDGLFQAAGQSGEAPVCENELENKLFDFAEKNIQSNTINKIILEEQLNYFIINE